MKNIKKYSDLIIEYIDWLVLLILALFIVILGLLSNINEKVVMTVTLLLLEILAIGAIRDRYTSKKFRKTLDELKNSNIATLFSEGILLDRAQTGIERVISQTVHYDWLSEIVLSTNVTIAKLKLNFTNDPAYYDAFEKILEKGGSVTIVLADPRSVAVWLRYKEEPNPNWTPKSPTQETAWIRGMEELAEESYRLIQWKNKLSDEKKIINKLVIKIFPHYPTHAFYKFDNKLFVYHYPFMERGFHAPAFLFTNPNTVTYQFLLRCLNSIITAAIPLEEEYNDIWNQCQSGLLSDKEVANAKIIVKRKR